MLLGFVNTMDIAQGGVHIEGFTWGVERIINDFARDAKLVEDYSYNFTGNELLDGLTAVISMWHPRPAFEGSMLRKLSSPELEDAVFHLTFETFKQFSQNKPVEMRRIVESRLDIKNSRKIRRYGA
jgi:DNA gyrase subunit B